MPRRKHLDLVFLIESAISSLFVDELRLFQCPVVTEGCSLTSNVLLAVGLIFFPPLWGSGVCWLLCCFSCPPLLIYSSSESCSFLRSSDWDNLSSSRRQDSFSGLQHWLMVTDRVSVCLPGNVLSSLSVVKDGFMVDRRSGWQAVILRAWIMSFHAFLALQMSEGTSNVSSCVSWHFPFQLFILFLCCVLTSCL